MLSHAGSVIMSITRAWCQSLRNTNSGNSFSSTSNTHTYGQHRPGTTLVILYQESICPGRGTLMHWPWPGTRVQGHRRATPASTTRNSCMPLISVSQYWLTLLQITNLHASKVGLIQVIHEGGHGLLDAVLSLVNHRAIPACGGEQLARGAVEAHLGARQYLGSVRIWKVLSLKFYSILFQADKILFL